MIEPPPRSLRLRLDREALAGNWRALDRMSGRAAAGAAVNADAYGLGIANVVPVLRDAGCTAFFVAHWSEVADLLAHTPPGQVAVLHGPVHAEDAAYARQMGVRPVINSLHQARLWLDVPYHLPDAASRCGMSQYELLTTLGRRFRRGA